MTSANGEAWAQLVCTSDPLADTVSIIKDRFVIGRSKGADLSLIGNKLLSGSHCHILKDDSGVVWLKDTSSNGTLLNYKKKICGDKVELKHGDEFHLVYKKDESHLNVSYLFQDLVALQAEEESEATQDYNDLDTSVTSTTQDEFCTSSSPDKSPASTKRRRDSDSQDASDSLAGKKVKLDLDGKVYCVANTLDIEYMESERKPNEKNDNKAGTSDKKEKRKTGDSTEKNTGEEKETKEKQTESKKDTEGMEDDLICIICQEILHDCVSCQPCLHCFCAGCYSDWMKRSNECPACREQVDKVNKNHMVSKVVATFLREHPHRKRAQEELDELDKRNTIKTDSVKPRPPKRTMSEFIDAEDEDSNDEDEREEDEDDDEDPSYRPRPAGTGLFGRPVAPTWFTGATGMFGTGGFGTVTYRPPKTVCRQCPEYTDDGTSGIATAASAITGAVSRMVGMVTGAGASTSPSASTVAGPSSTDGDTKTMPIAPPHRCPDSQIHLMCQCCMKPMPDRRAHKLMDDSIPSQQCVLCFRMFCHMYWGCRRDECLGCLGKFREINFGKKILDSLVLENSYESEVLKVYLDDQKMGTHDLLRECCVRLEAGDYSTADQVRGFTRNTVTCYSCGLRNFRELAYQYRKDIPRDDISSAARSRPDCYWGKSCRTQRKMAHAVKFNHICEQSKTS